ncbi:Neuropilin and tolloid-like protein 2 [Schistosoma japonicum]|nr:Neuropilin and tolloid-like protein 2 [Schistosoma japonicum]
MLIKTNWMNPICRLLWITALLIHYVQCDRDLMKPNKLIIGSLIEMDYWSLYRLPNQSTVCDQFINSYYLDDLNENTRSSSSSSSSLVTSSGSSTSSAAVPISSSSSPSASSLSGSNLWDRNKQSNWINTIEFDPIGLTGLMQLPKQDKPNLFDYNQRLKTVLRTRQPTLFTFTSPLYPDNYPPNTDCIKVIKAPQEDQQIILDFRGPFEFEPSADCINDYLEVRDGEYGFSPLIGRFCSDNRQLHSIKSTGRWLRLRYHSDFSIEKAGFQAVYYFSKLRNKDEPLPQKPIITTTIIVDNQIIFDKQHLVNLWDEYTESIIKKKSHPIDRSIEFIIDFRTNQSDLILMTHLKFVKFQLIDPECKSNLIEIYDEFFLSSRDSILPIPSVLLKRSKGKIPVNEKFTPRVIQACNRPSLESVIHKLGRGVIRILISPESRSIESMEYTLNNTTKPITKLPEVKIIATVLKKALCENDWIPCVRPTDYIAYKEYFNLTIRSRQSNKDLITDSSSIDKNDKQNLNNFNIQTPTPSLVMTTMKNTKIVTNPVILQRHSTLPKIIYCLPLNLICNGELNCPQGEDEEMCPRPPGGLEAFDMPIHEHNHMNDLYPQTTEQALTTGKLDSMSTSSEDDDEFHHHTPIIAGLLGFCAICGLISAGMTLMNRSKKQNHPNFGSVCNSILFESGTSLITALDSSASLTNLKSLQINDSKCEKLSFVDNSHQKSQFKDTYSTVITMPTSVSTTTLTTTTTNVTDTLRQEDVKPLKTSSNCMHLNCTNLCLLKTLNKHKAPIDDDDDGVDEDNDEDVEKQEQNNEVNNISYDRKSTTNGLAEIFDRATKPLSYIHKLDSSPAWNQASNHNTIHHLRETYNSKSTYNPYLLSEYSTNRSFGQLPNTLVIPVDKLTKSFYSPTMKQQSIPKSYYKSKISRSDPFSLREQSRFKTINNDCSYQDEHLQFDKLRRSFSVRPIKNMSNSSSAFTPYVSCASLKQATLPAGLLEFSLNDKHDLKSYYQTRYSLEQQQQQNQHTSDMNIFSIMNTQYHHQQQQQSQQWKREQKRKHFKGSAPKRAKHENNFMFQEQSPSYTTPVHQRIIIDQNDLPQYLQKTRSTPRELFTLYKSSQSTSGELLDVENEQVSHCKLSGKDIKRIPPSTTMTTVTTVTSVTPITSIATTVSDTQKYHHTKLYHTQQISPSKTSSNRIIIPNSKQWNIHKQNSQYDGSSCCISQNDESETTSENDLHYRHHHQYRFSKLESRSQREHSIDKIKSTRQSEAKGMKYHQLTSSISVDQDPMHNNSSLTTGTNTPKLHEGLQLFENSNEIFRCNCKLNNSSKFNFPSSYSVVQQSLSDLKNDAYSSNMRKNASWNDMSYKNDYLYHHDNNDDDDDEDNDDLDEQINENSERSSEVGSSSLEQVDGSNGYIKPQSNQSPNATLSPDNTSEESHYRLNMSNHSTPMKQLHGTSVVIITSKGRTVQSTNIA